MKITLEEILQEKLVGKTLTLYVFIIWGHTNQYFEHIALQEHNDPECTSKRCVKTKIVAVTVDYPPYESMQLDIVFEPIDISISANRTKKVHRIDVNMDEYFEIEG